MVKHKKNHFLNLKSNNFYRNFFPYFLCFMNKSLKSDNVPQDEKVKKLFHSFENQHLNFLNVGFFLRSKTKININLA